MTTFKTYWQALSADEKKALVTDTGLHYSYLCRLAGGQKKAGAETISKLSKARPELTNKVLRPDLFAHA